VDWTALLRLPTTVSLILAAVALLLALFELLALRQSLGERRPVAAVAHALLLALAALLCLLLAALAWSLQGYRFLSEETPVVEIDARILSPQRWALSLTWPDEQTRQLALAGDAFRIEAVVVKWQWPALLAGAPALYRLDRISGRYDDATQEMQAPRTVLDFREAGAFDLLDLKKRYPDWLPGVDTLFGSGAYLPLVDQGHYTVSLMRTGALVARPDEATEQRLKQPF